MNQLEQQLLREESEGAEPRLVVRARTRIDTGRWWRRTSLWLCVMPDALILLAVSRRRYIERVPLADCRETHYCHASGELVFQPIEGLTYSRFRVSPREALAILGILKTEH